MSGYLDLARRIRAARERSKDQSGSRLESEAATDTQAPWQNEVVHLDYEGRNLKAAGFEPKLRGRKIIWQRPDTGFWLSQEMALHLLERKSTEEDLRI